jgi:hypothetical protein
MVAAIFAAQTVAYDLWHMRGTYKSLINRAGAGAIEKGLLGEKKGEDRREEGQGLAHEEMSDHELVKQWKKLKRDRDFFMLAAGILGIIGCLVISGKDRRAFLFW